MAGATGSVNRGGSSLKAATGTKQTGHDFTNTSGANIVLNKAALLAQTATSGDPINAEVQSFEFVVLSTPSDAVTCTVTDGSNVMALQAGDGEGRQGTDNDDNTLSPATDLQLTVPDQCSVRARWVEITA